MQMDGCIWICAAYQQWAQGCEFLHLSYLLFLLFPTFLYVDLVNRAPYSPILIAPDLKSGCCVL